ncbi:MAG: DUF1178 family protein [Rhizobiaceae bacterium]|nr:DUF1178 family protein [Rhizobiaceae bacterium]
MIKYSLSCENKHDFEGWFSSSSDFDTQKKRGLVTCPLCDTSKIDKTLMTPSLSTGRQLSKTSSQTQRDATLATNTKMPPESAELIKQLRNFRDNIQANAENVGKKFPEEARKIHYGEADKRGIYGQASKEEVRDLVDEGVEVMPLPTLPEDTN